ncbi:hypothetical protein VTN77DRAFT_1909 [Rasamsonia byssochlamydoides]|uniref:uncharacterized protein n=1 Tax=Rasamsonia byssochlamydoides TaxID=89139 RepID=UPI0037423CC0
MISYPPAGMAASIGWRVDATRAMDCERDFDEMDLDMVYSDCDEESTAADAESDSVTFLDLPDHVRVKIYRYAHLVRPCPIDVAKEKQRFKGQSMLCLRSMPDLYQEGDWNTSFYMQTCEHPPIPVNIFRVSQAVYEDAALAFFSLNRFQLTLRNLDDLIRFKSATGPFQEYLQSIHVTLRCYDGRILKSSPRAKSTFNLWEKFCSLVARHMPALRYFSFDCRVNDVETAENVVGYFDYFRRLTHCALRFDSFANSDLQEIARKAAVEATMIAPTSSPSFPFLDLPEEIQLMVLEHLLIVRWDPFVQSSEFARGQLIWQNRKQNRPRVLYCCGTCSPNLRNCFCSLRQNAFSTNCTCFVSPLPYFLVSRHMYSLARDVFYSKNRFSFVGDDPRAMFRFLHCLPAESLHMIRYVTFTFPRAHRYVIRVDQKYYDSVQMDWSILIRFITEHFHLERLSVNVVDMGSGVPMSGASEAWKKFIREVLKGFTPLRGVRRFQVYLAEDRGYETVAEKAIMGPDYRPPTVKHLPFVGAKHPHKR